MNTTVYRPFGALRFFLALLVLCQHSLHCLPLGNRSFFYHAELGVIAVATFFAISGFIVAESNGTFYRDRPQPFMLNRLLRLVPPYLAALFVAMIVCCGLYAIGQFQTWDGSLQGPPWQPLLLLSGVLDIVPFFQPRYITNQNFTFIGFAWTLRVEFAFYIFAFVTYWFLSRNISALMRRMGAIASFGLAYVLFFTFVASGGKLPQQSLDIPFFMFGVCLYRLWKERTLFNVLHLAIAIICVFIAFPFWQQLGTPVLAEQFPILIILYAAFATLAFVPNMKDAWKTIDKHLGDLSYPLYLNHISVLFLLSNIGTEHLGWRLYAIGFVASIALSVLMFWIVEIPLKSLRDRVRGTAL